MPDAVAPDAVSTTDVGQELEKIDVRINYDIIRLFSEGLYKSPHKAVEELVCNGYDAGALRVHVLVPQEQPAPGVGPLTHLWVIDDGHGMDEEGFRRLWTIAQSEKADAPQTMNGTAVGSSKERQAPLHSAILNEELDGLGRVEGRTRIYRDPLTGGKSSDRGRSNGFFIRVRGRVINLEDELFGLEPLNHTAWSRFSMEVTADGLRQHLLSSREGVRDLPPINVFRDRLRAIFNECRNVYQAEPKDQAGIDIAQLLAEAPMSRVTEPLLASVRSAVRAGVDSFYIAAPAQMPEEDRDAWLDEYARTVRDQTFDKTRFERAGANAPAVRYDPATHELSVNVEHPFVDKLSAGGRRKGPAELFASSEILIEGQLQEHGMDRVVVAHLLAERDRVLRLAAGHAPPTALEVVRRLGVANRDETALERAVGAAFQILGFDYERRGGPRGGPEGVLSARLGRHGGTVADYTLVYDTKQTEKPACPADKCNFASLEDSRVSHGADYGFFAAVAYQGEDDSDGKLNRQLAHENNRRLTLLKTSHLLKLINLHCRFGLTLTELRHLFDTARTVSDVDVWIEGHAIEPQVRIPLRSLLEGLEKEKDDSLAKPSVAAVRAKRADLQAHDPDQLAALLQAVSTVLGHRWIEVDTDKTVRMHNTAKQILEEFDRQMSTLGSETAALE